MEEAEHRLWALASWGWPFYVCVCGPCSDLTRKQVSVAAQGARGPFRRRLNWVFSIRAIEPEIGVHFEANSNGLKALLGLQSSANL